ncbi:MAG: S-methyl-5-thioribose-1-phosphate isomerase [bacterium]
MRTIKWDSERNCPVMVDQTKLPETVTQFHAETVSDVIESIKTLRVRGAPAIGAAGAYGVALSTREHEANNTGTLLNRVRDDADKIASARPTAVNLSKGVQRVLDSLDESMSIEELREEALEAAETLADEDVETNKRIGRNGETLLESGQTVMTHCNAGSLATVEWGTALGIVYSAHEAGKDVDVITNETRPLNQGSRITTTELMEHDVETILIPDNASGLCFQEGRVDALVVGADRVLLDAGESYDHQALVYNKIGTYKHAVIANRHDIPVIVAVPTSTIDPTSTAEDVEIELRDEKELLEIYGEPNAPEAVDVYNPAFDSTPAELVDYLVTEHGVFEPPFTPEKILPDS